LIHKEFFSQLTKLIVSRSFLTFDHATASVSAAPYFNMLLRVAQSIALERDTPGSNRRDCQGSVLFERDASSVGLCRGLLQLPREGRMSKFAIRLLTVAIYAATPGVAPLVAPAKAETGSGRHIKKHQQKRPGFSDPWSAGRAWPVTRPSSQAGGICPGMGRGIDCRTWPPPMDEDPDRKASGADGG